MPEVPRPAGRHAGQCVLEHRRLGRIDPEALGRGQERVRRRFPPQPFGPDRHAVDDLLDVLRESGHLQYFVGVGTRRHHGPPESGLLRRPAGSAGSPRTRARPRSGSAVERPRSSGCPRPFTVIAAGGRPAYLRAASIPRAVRKSRTPLARGLPSTYASYSLRASNGHERDPVLLRVVPEELVEHLFPRGGVHGSGIGEHTIQVEQADPDPRG